MNKIDKQREIIIKISIAGAIVALLYLFINPYYTQHKKNEKLANKANPIIHQYFDFGSISDSIYCNDFFKFKITIPKGFEGKYKKYDYVEKNLIERDSTPIAPRLALDIQNCNILLIEPEIIKIDWLNNFKENGSLAGWEDYNSKKSKRDLLGSECQLSIRVHNLSETPLHAYMSKFENLHNPDYGNFQTRKISGIMFKEYHGVESQGSSIQETTFRLMGGENKNIISYNSKINDFAFSIDLFYTTEEQKGILLEIANNISFY